MIKMTGNRDAARRFDRAAKGLGKRLFERVVRISDEIKCGAQEIRLRVNRPVAVYTAEQVFFIAADGRAITEPEAGRTLTASQRDIADCFQNLCSYSVYSRQNEIRQGFITLQGGHRAGLSGSAVYRNGEIYNIRDISGVNIRIAREILGCADELIACIKENNCGILVCGAPSSGKTTLLRDTARQLSTVCGMKTTVIDERGELAGVFGGIAQNDLGMSDVLDGFSKTDGIMQAVRCLSPDYIICDEIGTAREAQLIEQSLNSGVKIIASMHASSAEELLRRPQGEALLKTGAFGRVAFLKSRKSPGEISELMSGEVLLRGKGGRNINDNGRRSFSGSYDFQKGNKQNTIF